MSQHTTVYDLGSIDDQARPKTAEIQRGGRRPGRSSRSEFSHMHTSVGVDVPGMLSLFVPGAGQMACGEIATGLFILSWTGLFGALAWALLVTIERVIDTLRILGFPGAPAVWTLCVLYVFMALFHIGAILTAGPRDGWRPAHPVLAGLASTLVPGWGQILSGSRTRAAFFVCCLWAIAALWLLDVPMVQNRLGDLGIYLPDSLDAVTSPAVRWIAPAVLWALAVYDAIASASRR